MAVTSALIAELTSDLWPATAPSAQTAQSTPAPAIIIAPFTGEPLHELTQNSAADVAAATNAAREAQRSWRAAGFAHRRSVLLRAHGILLERRREILDLLQTETGKARGQAFEELFQAASVTRYVALSARRVLATEGRRSALPTVVRTRVNYSPKGVIGIITPWNYPLSLALMDAVPALATGNAVVQKADNQGALTILAARRAFIDAGVPAELWAVVAGSGDEVGTALVEAADYVCFTGSTATGLRVAERAASSLTGVSLELGGKNPLIVLDDVDAHAVAQKVAYACFSSAGQLCVSIERIYVERAVAGVFIAALRDAVRALTLGSALDYSTDLGSLTNAAQVERVRAHIDDAVARGAEILVGGFARPDLGPYFWEPTVLLGVTDAMACNRAETFGPVVALHIVASDDEAIAAANDSEFGLNASVFGGSLRRARRVAARLHAGSVNINEGYRGSFSTVDAPMGGVGMSGLGRRNGPEGMLRFVDAKTTSEATGIVTLPSTGAQSAALEPVMIGLLGVLRALRRR